MALWNKTKTQRRSAGTDTLIGEGTLWEGRCSAEADIRIEGEVVGDVVTSGVVVIGEKGVVRSEVTAKDVTIAGHMEGTVKAEGVVRIMSSGRLVGTVHAGCLVIEKGAVFQGTSLMDGGQEGRIFPCAVV